MTNIKPLYYIPKSQVYSELKNVSREKAYAWGRIKEEVEKMQLPKGWSASYYEASVVYNAPTRTHSIKITLTGEIYVEYKLGKGKFKSEKFILHTTNSALDKLKELFAVLEQA